MKVLGVDGCKGGWIAFITMDNKFQEARFFPMFTLLVESFPDADIIAVDIPIGLAEKHPRRADQEAKRFLGKRAPVVFMTPPRQVLKAASYEEARKVAEEQGCGVTAQAYALRDKILEVEPIAADNHRIYEVHPEISFQAMANATTQWKKKTWNGLFERLQLLEKTGLRPPDFLGEVGLHGAPDDIVDAGAAAWSGARLARHEAQSLPAIHDQKWKGRPMAIWY